MPPRGACRRAIHGHEARRTMSVIYDRVALIGLGLIASSMFWAMKRAGLAGEVTGYARSAETRAAAREIGLCDRVFDSAAEAVEGADLVVLCVPVGVMGAVTQEIATALKPGATVSDVGSVKGAVIEAVAPHLPAGVHFVPAHPMAGTEHSGPRSGFAELFDGKYCLIVPIPGSDRDAVDRLERLWQGMGAKTDEMRRVTDSEIIKYSAAGFRDFTRIAASDPTMWRDVFLSNKEATLEILGRFTEELFALQRAIRTGDGDHLHDYFTRTRAIRRGIIEAGQDTDAPDFGRVKKA